MRSIEPAHTAAPELVDRSRNIQGAVENEVVALHCTGEVFEQPVHVRQRLADLRVERIQSPDNGRRIVQHRVEAVGRRVENGVCVGGELNGRVQQACNLILLSHENRHHLWNGIEVVVDDVALAGQLGGDPGSEVDGLVELAAVTACLCHERGQGVGQRTNFTGAPGKRGVQLAHHGIELIEAASGQNRTERGKRTFDLRTDLGARLRNCVAVAEHRAGRNLRHQ